MDQVNCRLEIPQVKGLNPAEMTVGRHVLLTCEGSYSKSFDLTKAQFKLDDQNKFTAKILKAEARSAQSFDIEMTFYIAGQAQFPDLVITDGVNEISLGQQKFQIQSVIEKTETGQPPKPFGYLVPLKLDWPAFYLIFFVSFLGLIILALVLQVRKAARYAKMIADLRNYNSPLAPDLQFYKTIRTSEKNQYPIEELEKAFRLYVLRVFEVPMFVLNHRQIKNFFKIRKPRFKNERLQVDKFLSEFEEIQINKKELKDSEKLELVTKLYRFVGKTQNLGSQQ
jgi:hypothetical protein